MKAETKEDLANEAYTFCPFIRSLFSKLQQLFCFQVLSRDYLFLKKATKTSLQSVDLHYFTSRFFGFFSSLVFCCLAFFF